MLLGLSGAGYARERALTGRHPGLGPHTPSVQGGLQEGRDLSLPSFGRCGEEGEQMPLVGTLNGLPGIGLVFMGNRHSSAQLGLLTGVEQRQLQSLLLAEETCYSNPSSGNRAPGSGDTSLPGTASLS